MLNHQHFVTSTIHNFNAMFLQSEEHIGLTDILHFVVAVSQCLHGRPVLQLLLIVLFRRYKWLRIRNLWLIKIIESKISIAANRHLVGARGVNNHLLPLFIPLITQDYPFKKWVINEL